jgi:hypothetical protein
MFSEVSIHVDVCVDVEVQKLYIRINAYVTSSSCITLSSSPLLGLLISDPQIFTDPEKFVYLWVHESERVYGEDRLL